VAKLLNNALTMTNLKNAEDVLGFADVLGVDVAAFLQLLRTSNGGSFVLNALGNEITSELAPHLQGLMRKDIEHFADAVSRRGVDVDDVRSRGIAGAEGLVTVTELVDRHRAVAGASQ
jgi:3-hydroxyisobutyrate dehydrogenase-like beta-hydroxyacid dehydrogenase